MTLSGPTKFPGCANFSRVAPGLWRGAHPGTDGLLALHAAGACVWVDLRQEAEAGKAAAKALRCGLAYVRIPIQDHHAPTDLQAAQFLGAVKAGPAAVFCACHMGVGRCGTMIAAWRLTQGWSVRQAIEEASLFHPLFLGLPVPFVSGIEPAQERWLRAWATAAGYPMGDKP